ncbi:acyltransferase family protein [Winslowiella sp. 2C04]|uniref:acyltransferase family protein n=1 Tax=Winslowiella sp. 2C04 TaxID=3416179 RepID=UPI003CF6E39A
MRYYYGLDSLRAIMMIFGIFIHAALFVNYSDWSYKSVHGTSTIISLVFQYVSLFRMECFFILCGFLACMLFTHKDRKYFLNNRKERVMVPLLSSFILFILIPNILIKNQLTYELKHLWFLLTLLILSLISCYQPVLNLIKKLTLNVKFCCAISFIFFTWAVLSFVGTKINTNGITNELFENMILRPLYFSVFYLTGFMLFKRENLKIIENRIYYIAFFAVVFSIASTYLYDKKYIIQNISFVEQLFKTCSDFLSGMFISLSLLFIFLRIDYSSRLINFLKDSSLIIYVSHFGVIQLLAPQVDKISDNVYDFYIYLCLATLMSCVIIYHIINFFNFTRFLFGIRNSRRSATTT